MGNCCSEDNTPFNGEIDVEDSGLPSTTLPLQTDDQAEPTGDGYNRESDAPVVSLAIPDQNGQADTAEKSNSDPSSNSATEAPSSSDAPPPPADLAPPSTDFGFNSSNTPSPESAPPPPSAMQDNASTPFVLQQEPDTQTQGGLRPGAKAEEDFTNLPPAETRMTGSGGFALIYSQTAGGTLAAKWVQNGPPTGCIAFLRIEDEIDDLKLYNQPFQCGKNVRSDWINQAKALGVYLKQCWTFRGELELLPDFNIALPRRAVLVFHGVDLGMTKTSAPAAIDTADGKYDACAVMPAVSETFKGQATLKLNAFLEKAVRRGAAVRF